MKNTSEKQFSQQTLYVAIFTTVTVLAWIGFEVFRSLTTTEEKIEISKQALTPLSRELRVEVLDSLKRRLQIPQQILDDVEGTGGMTASTDSATIDTEAKREATSSGSN